MPGGQGGRARSRAAVQYAIKAGWRTRQTPRPWLTCPIPAPSPQISPASARRLHEAHQSYLDLEATSHPTQTRFRFRFRVRVRVRVKVRVRASFEVPPPTPS